MTHEEFIHRVREIALTRVENEALRVKLASAKLVYGVGSAGLRGVCYYGAWQNGQPEPTAFVEVCARGEESPIQLAGTTIHELAHVLAGSGAGHGKDWKAAAQALGLNARSAAGQDYCETDFDESIRAAILELASPKDGRPIFATPAGLGLGGPFAGLPPLGKAKACPMGIGTRGGKSRGAGSGSRLRKWTCGCEPKPVVVRVASDDFRATCDRCGSAFKQAESKR